MKKVKYDIGGSSKSRQNEDGRAVWKMWTIDEILILQLLILGEDSIIETIVTLTSEGVLTSTSIQGENGPNPFMFSGVNMMRNQ